MTGQFGSAHKCGVRLTRRDCFLRDLAQCEMDQSFHRVDQRTLPYLRFVNVRSMKISLTPRTTEFFTLFTKDGQNALEVARLVERRFREHPNSVVTQEQVKAGETAGDV